MCRKFEPVVVFVGGNNKYSVHISGRAVQMIANEILRAGSVETGGIMLGFYSADQRTATITEAQGPPRDSKQTATTFERGNEGVGEMLRHAWDRRVKRYYVGDWHYHPHPIVEPSPRDKSSLARIAKNPLYECVSPLMLIVGRPGDSGQIPARCFVYSAERVHELRDEGLSSFR